MGFVALWVLLLMHAAQPAWSSTPAGTKIVNQASASYSDSHGTSYIATSNLVTTEVNPVAGVVLLQDQMRFATTNGGDLTLPHVLNNTGNTADSFDLELNNLAGGTFDFSALAVYPDSNRDGQADSLTPMDLGGSGDTPVLAPGEAFYFVVVATVPAGEAAGDQDQYTVTGTSTCVSCGIAPGESLSDSNTDTVVITDRAILQIAKSVSASGGPSPSSPTTFDYTISYQNVGSMAASDVQLVDALPAGLSYVPGSARWSVLGATPLEETDPDVDDGGIRFCVDTWAGWSSGSCATGVVSPQPSRAEAPDALQNPDGSQYSANDQIAAVIATVAAGGSGVVSFSFTVDAGLSAETLYNVAELFYDADAAPPLEHMYSNFVPFTVESSFGVVANGSNTDSTDLVGEPVTVNTAGQGAVVEFVNTVWNTGNGADTFDLSLAGSTFPAGTTFLLFHSDGFTPLVDTDASSEVDTGSIPVPAAGSCPAKFVYDSGNDRCGYQVVLKAALPPGASGNNGGAGFAVTLTATSTSDRSQGNAVIDQLSSIVVSSVDLTNNLSLASGCNDSATCGFGSGAETNPVSIVAAGPAGTAIFQLIVNNTSTVVDSYDLSYSNTDFAAGQLPAGWAVTFHEDGGSGDCSTRGAAVANTGTIAPGGDSRVCATVTLPTDAIAGGEPVSLYFRATSQLTGATDTKHDAVLISAESDLFIEPDQFGQVGPGGIVYYSHIVSNRGNTTLECLDVAMSDTLQNDGWASVLYVDVNGDGLLDASDTPWAPTTLAPGSDLNLIVRIFAPSNALPGTINTTTLMASGNADDGDGDHSICTGALLTAQSTDTTTLTTSDVVIRKQQAPDVSCDGTADAPFSATAFSASPGSCIIYRLTATNTSVEDVHNVIIHDASPAFTFFNNVGPLPTVSAGSVVVGANGTTGIVEGGSVGGSLVLLNPGEVLQLEFGVQVE